MARISQRTVGSDGRNRCLLGAYGTKTARNAPSNAQFVFGPAKWIRFFIAPPPGLALVHRDFSQQEVRIAAVLSGDAAMLAACESGDVYIATGEQIGMIRTSMSAEERAQARDLMKTVVLGISYGMQAFSLSRRTGLSVDVCEEIFARIRATRNSRRSSSEPMTGQGLISSWGHDLAGSCSARRTSTSGRCGII